MRRHLNLRTMRCRLLFIFPIGVLVSMVTTGIFMQRDQIGFSSKVATSNEELSVDPQVMINGTRKRISTKTTAVLARIPNPVSLEKRSTFSACLLIRDDNDILNEWIAYHYHVLRLRYLIVAVDPLSDTSPSDILDKWRDVMTVQEWNDTVYMPDQFLTDGRPPDEYMLDETELQVKLGKNFTYDELKEISSHRYRQRVFLAKCIKALKEKKRTWTMHIDTDEFVIANKILRQLKVSKPERFSDVPDMDRPGSVLEFLKNAVKENSKEVGYPCISMLRVLFGSSESKPAEINAAVPKGFNATKFETLRWRHHLLPHNRTQHGYGKVILDISRIPLLHLADDIVYSIHRPIQRLCRSHERQSYNSFREFPLTANHYLGSWERYNARTDKRRSREAYEQKAKGYSRIDDGTRPWLRGFVSNVGYENATKLLGHEYLLQHGPRQD